MCCVRVAKMVRTVVQAIQVIELICYLKFNNCSNSNIAITTFFVVTGGPLVGEQIINEKTNKDSFWYLVGVVSFGPRVWFALNNYFIILLLNCTWCYPVLLLFIFSGTRGFPGDRYLSNYFRN